MILTRFTYHLLYLILLGLPTFALPQSGEKSFLIEHNYLKAEDPELNLNPNFKHSLGGAPYGNDLSLLVSAGLAANPAILSKLKQVDVARAGVDGAKWGFFPTPSVLLQQARTPKNDTNYQGSNKVFQIGLQQPLWTGGRLSNSLTLAEKKMVLALVDLQEIKDRVAYSIISAFCDWASANQKVAAYDDTIQSYRNLEGIIQRRIAAGLSPESDYIFAKGRLDQLLADLEAAKTQRENALVGMSQAIGSQISSADLLPIRKALPLHSVNTDEVLLQALERNPAILKAKAQIEIQDSQLALTKSSALPTLSLSLQRQNGNFSYSNFTSNSENLMFLNFSTNFGAGLSSISQISGAISQKESAEADEAMAKQNIRGEIFSTIANLKNALYRLKALDSACISAESTAQSWQRQFMAGRKGWQDLLNSTRELSGCRASVADAKQSLILLNWRLAISSIGLDQALTTLNTK